MVTKLLLHQESQYGVDVKCKYLTFNIYMSTQLKNNKRLKVII